MRDNSSQTCWSSFGCTSRVKYPEEIVNGYILNFKIKGVPYLLHRTRRKLDRLP